MTTYLYPQNLKATANLWMWSLRNFAIMSIALLLSILILAQTRIIVPLEVTLCFGWISIAGTNINYPVMHTPSNPQKCLNKSYYGEYSFSGTPFLDARCSSDSTNLIIYGHHMNNGTMFADLCNYTDYSYFTEHPMRHFITRDIILTFI